MSARFVAIGLALILLGFGSSAWADEMDEGGFPVEQPRMQPPPPPPPEPMAKPVTAAPPPHVVALQTTSIGAGIGLSWGDGTLLFEGERHAFSVKGMSLGELGAAKAIASGRVQNLDRLSDFAGRYVAVEAGGALGVGASALTMRNQHGVVIQLQSSIQGAQLKLGAEGLSIALD